ncbi:MAG TPA: hypothetical protein VGN17_01085 [Bryobacteraceae bacterium]|jgi:hypothetical protein
MSALHCSTAYVAAIADRGRAPKPHPISDQFRFIVRLAVACHAQHVPYSVGWSIRDQRMQATIMACGKIPVAKPLPRPPKSRPVSDWRPAIWDATYQLDAWHDAKLGKRRPGFVIAHSCGLSLVHPSESGELGVGEDGANEDIRQGWLVTHAASGRGFGLTLSFKRAADALLLAASFPVDWTQDADALQSIPDFQRAGQSVLATYGDAHSKDSAKRRLAELERAA